MAYKKLAAMVLGRSQRGGTTAVPNMVPRGLEPRTLRLLAVRSNQLSYRTSEHFPQEHLSPRAFKISWLRRGLAPRRMLQ